MTGTTDDHDIAAERPELLLFCGAAGLIGNLAPLLTIAWASAVIDHDMIADTVSDLARGPHRLIMDCGFYLNAAGLMALAIGAAHAHLGRLGWSLGIFALTLLALVVVLLGVWDAFGATAEGSGMSVHTTLSFLLAPLYVAGPLLMAPGIARLHGWMKPSFIAAAILFLLFAAGFKLAPTAYDGILEKIALAATLAWTLPLSWALAVRGRSHMHRLTSD